MLVQFFFAPVTADDRFIQLALAALRFLFCQFKRLHAAPGVLFSLRGQSRDLITSPDTFGDLIFKLRDTLPV